MKRLASFIAAALMLLPPSAAGQQAGPDRTTPTTCLQAIGDRLAQQQRVFRQVIFGRRPAAEMPLNAVRYDKLGNAWIKINPSDWRTDAEAFRGESRSDDDIDRNSEWENMNFPGAPAATPRRSGIVERKESLTSELIPDIVLAFRSFQCQTDAVCVAADASYRLQPPETDNLLRVQPLGCEDMLIPTIEECRFGNADGEQAEQLNNIVTGTAESAIRLECQPLAEQLIEREIAAMRIAVAYDASTRTLLQFAGSFDGFLSGLRGDMLAPIEETLGLLGTLSRIPCFTAQCNE